MAPIRLSEKEPVGNDLALPTHDSSYELPPNRRPSPKKLIAICLAGSLFGFLSTQLLFPSSSRLSAGGATTQSVCQQSPILTPRGNVTDLYSEKAKERIIDWLSGAVKVPTEAYDDMADVEGDERFKVFGVFHKYKTLSVEKVNTYGLAYEWTGSDPSLKPLMLAAHQDVVPVERSTVLDWTYPPFSGHYDGTNIWGRGSSDDKTGLISIMSAVELLIEGGFKPTRTVVLAYGFDEECGGKVGALALGKYLEEKYGRDSMLMLVDEGSGMTERYGQTFAEPSTGEKGYLDVELSVATPGGHSSVPPPHTGIGLLALAINTLENNPMSPYMTRKNPLYSAMQCYAHYGHIDGEIKDTLKLASGEGKRGEKALKKLAGLIAGLGGQERASVTTTRAVDLVKGGVKVNALPELSQAVINHRINTDSSVAELQEEMINVLQPLTEEYELSFHAFGKEISDLKDARGTLTLAEAFDSALEPARVSPSDTDSPAWNLLSGSAKATWSTRKGADHTDLIMVPGLGIGNTDTKRYWNLTRNIYRFGYLLASEAGGNSYR
ncbi:hypothetical protein QFC20_004443 [Naganishia adeliensis]|uniref:Uncharacterized protein n=1 Tax=Naganishia adeliensis TaxID=92952 RepID=A0ACC2W2Y4_9TREE|nr:hypothetical protein QFC20_004443 [Naganishia adeliensis]